jgi:hypothetical protein
MDCIHRVMALWSPLSHGMGFRFGCEIILAPDGSRRTYIQQGDPSAVHVVLGAPAGAKYILAVGNHQGYQKGHEHRGGGQGSQER